MSVDQSCCRCRGKTYTMFGDSNPRDANAVQNQVRPGKTGETPFKKAKDFSISFGVWQELGILQENHSLGDKMRHPLLKTDHC